MYTAPRPLRRHLEEEHADSITQPATADFFLESCSRPLTELPAVMACPLCDDYEPHSDLSTTKSSTISVADIKRHLADHLEQLALFAIPPAMDDEQESSSRQSDGVQRDKVSS